MQYASVGTSRKSFFNNTPVIDLYLAGTEEAFALLPKEEQRGFLSEMNLGLTTYGLNEADFVFEQARAMGFIPLRLTDVVLCVAFLMDAKQVALPSGKKYKQQRGVIVQDILDKITVQISEPSGVAFNSLYGGQEQNILRVAKEQEARLKLLVETVITDSMMFGRILDFVRIFVRQSKILAVEQNNPTQIPIHGPRITLKPMECDLKPDVYKKSDLIITAVDPEQIRREIEAELIVHGGFHSRRQKLEIALAERELLVAPKFTLEDWPFDPLMRQLRQDVTPLAQAYLHASNKLCDPQDLKYQALFRLTTYPISEVFLNGDELDEYLHKQGAYKNWRNILRINPDVIKRYSLNEELVQIVLDEQYQIIKKRLSESTLPLDSILRRTGIFAESGWVIQKRDGGVYAVLEEGATSVSQDTLLEFKEVRPELAAQFHHDLHYIHTPRVDKAFGLYIKGEALPFSVLALELIDRPYKQNALLMQGYDPRKCYDLTRLYSRPGTPGNTSSSMFSLSFNYLRIHYPETQAILSSFMPSYANGVSMTSGGFDNPVLVKPLSHTFAERNVQNRCCYEHLTNRRMHEATGKKVRSQFPLLPTIELLSSLQPPRFSPLAGAEKFMIEAY